MAHPEEISATIEQEFLTTGSPNNLTLLYAAGMGDSKYRAHSLLRKYVRAGWLGRKTGRGVYNY